MARWRQIWIDFKGSFWFVPSLVVGGLLLLAMLSIEIDRRYFEKWEAITPTWIIFEKEAMRSILATIAGSMMTVAGVVFSITILVLAQASGLYTSRILRNFMRNRGNQFILGLFVGIFIFCLFLMTNVHPTNNAISALFAFLLALVGVAFLIYFIHYVATSIQANEIILNVANETIQGIDVYYKEEGGGEHEMASLPEFPQQVLSRKTGYIQAIDYKVLFAESKRGNNAILLLKKVGDFVCLDEPLCDLEVCDPSFVETIHHSISIGSYRIPREDIGCGILQLVDIALKGLSSGLNDPATANVSIDYLGNVFIHLARRHLGKRVYWDEATPRLIVPRHTFESLLAQTFPPIIENATSQSMVLKRLKETLNKILGVIESTQNKEQIEGYLAAIEKLLNQPEFL